MFGLRMEKVFVVTPRTFAALRGGTTITLGNIIYSESNFEKGRRNT